MVDALWRWLDQPRTLLKGGEWASGETFCRVGNAILKVSSKTVSGDLVYNVARNVVNCSRDQITISISPATEAELLDVLENAKSSVRLRVQEFLRVFRNEAAQPLEIKIVNAREVGSDRIVKVTRDDQGKLAGLVTMAAPFSEG